MGLSLHIPRNYSHLCVCSIAIGCYFDITGNPACYHHRLILGTAGGIDKRRRVQIQVIFGIRAKRYLHIGR